MSLCHTTDDIENCALVSLFFFFLLLGMVGYGMAKGAVHQLCQSLAGANSGLPSGSAAVAILP